MSSIRPTGLFAEKPAPKESTQLKQSYHQFEKTDELIYHVTHNTNNILHKDGRIYLKITASGELFAQSVSPYSKTFFDNIEPKIKDLVKSLIDKRYLTYSSCEGHDLTFRRYIGLAFVDEESREHLINAIKELKIKGIEFYRKDSVANCPIDVNEKGHYTYKEKIIPLNKINEHEIHAFNIQFHRQYERYYFLELVILNAVPMFEGKILSFKFISWVIKNIPLIIAKKFLVEKYTKKITEKIKSDSVKKYKY